MTLIKMGNKFVYCKRNSKAFIVFSALFTAEPPEPPATPPLETRQQSSVIMVVQNQGEEWVRYTSQKVTPSENDLLNENK